MASWLMRLPAFLKSFQHPFRRKVPGTEGVLGPGTRPEVGIPGIRTPPGGWPPRAVPGGDMRTGYRGDIGTRPAGPLNWPEHKVRAGAAAGLGAFAAYPF